MSEWEIISAEQKTQRTGTAEAENAGTAVRRPRHGRDREPVSEGQSGSSTPKELSEEELKLTRRAPRETEAEEAADETYASIVRHEDKRVNALWTVDERRNVWLSFAELGWRRIGETSESGVLALAILGAHAKETQCRVDLEEADGRVVALTCWE
jgi:hypothetical protein